MYCAEIGIKEHQYYWQRRLRVAADKELRKVESDKPGLINTLRQEVVARLYGQE
jgi:hypothetical protein